MCTIARTCMGCRPPLAAPALRWAAPSPPGPGPPLCALRRKVVVQYREDCRQLDADPRLAPATGSGAAGAREQQEELQGQARALSQAISALGSAVKADVEQVRSPGPGATGTRWQRSACAWLWEGYAWALWHAGPAAGGVCWRAEAVPVRWEVQPASAGWVPLSPGRWQCCARRCCTWFAPLTPRCTPSSARTRGARPPRQAAPAAGAGVWRATAACLAHSGCMLSCWD